MLAAQSLQCAGTETPGYAMLAGGFESMSNVPHYLPNSRKGFPLGHVKMLDGVIHDGLWDIYNDQVSRKVLGYEYCMIVSHEYFGLLIRQHSTWACVQRNAAETITSCEHNRTLML